MLFAWSLSSVSPFKDSGSMILAHTFTLNNASAVFVFGPFQFVPTHCDFVGVEDDVTSGNTCQLEAAVLSSGSNVSSSDIRGGQPLFGGSPPVLLLPIGLSETVANIAGGVIQHVIPVDPQDVLRKYIGVIVTETLTQNLSGWVGFR